MACTDGWVRRGDRTLCIRVSGDDTVGLISLSRERFDRCTEQSRIKVFSRAELEAGTCWQLRDCTRDTLRLTVEPKGATVDVTLDIDGDPLVNDKCTRGSDSIVGRWTVTVMCPGGRAAFCQGGN